MDGLTDLAGDAVLPPEDGVLDNVGVGDLSDLGVFEWFCLAGDLLLRDET